MDITFVLPKFLTQPNNEMGTINSFAKHLSDRGHTVTLIYPLELNQNKLQKKINNFIKIIKDWTGETHSPDKNLFYTDIPGVNIQVVYNLSPKYLPLADKIVATDWESNLAIQDLPKKYGEKYYFVQSWEPYFYRSRKPLQSLQTPAQKIALSEWIKEELIKLGQDPFGPVGNFIDQKNFYCWNDFDNRSYDIGLFHHSKTKNFKEELKILNRIKKERSSLNAAVLSYGSPKCDLPHWIDLTINPTSFQRRELYNEIKLLIYKNKKEGWPREPMEAMASGCVLISNQNKGVQEYINNQENGFLINSERKWFFFDTIVNNMVNKISYLLSNHSEAQKISQRASQIVQEYKAQKTIEKLEDILEA